MQMCPRCGADNPRPAKECEICGAALRGLLGRATVLQGRYRIDNVLGVGGFGAVYLATHLLLEHPVALKALFDTAAEAQRQFRREAQLLVRLRHPGLASVSDSFIEEDGVQYLAMEYIEGPSLVQYLDQNGPVPPPTALDWARQLLDVLGYIHQQTPPVMHRDIKPGNIIVKPNGKVVLVDFGIAKTGTEATTMAARAISPGFSPPEQYGQSSTTPRSDLYALGATLYFCLTRSVPPDSLERAFGQSALPPLSSLAPATPHPLEAAIETAMQPKAAERWSSAAEFAAALDDSSAAVGMVRAPATMALPATLPLPAAAAPATQAMPARRNYLALSGGALAVVALLAALFWSLNRPKTSAGPIVVAATATPDPLAIALPPSIDVNGAPAITLENVAAVTRTAQIGRPALVQALFSPSGGDSLLAVATTQEIAIYASDTGTLLRQIPIGFRSVTALDWSSDGKLLAIGRSDGVIQLRQASDGQLLRELTGHADKINTLAWAPGEQRLASGSVDLTIKLWDATSGQILHTLSGHTGEVSDLSWKSDGSRLASSGLDSTVRIWDPAAGTQERQLDPDGPSYYGISDVTWSNAAGDPFLAAATAFGDVRIWRTSDWQLARTLPIMTASYGALVWKPFQTELAIATTTNAIVRFNLTTSVSQTIATSLPVLGGIDWQTGQIAAQGEERLVVMADDGGERWSITGFNRSLRQAEWSPAGNQIATRSAIHINIAGWVQVWDVANSQPPISLPISSTELTTLDWSSATGQLLVAAWHDLSAWQPGTWQQTAVISTYSYSELGFPESVYDSMFEVAWNPAGDRVASLGLSGELVFWRLQGQTFATDGLTVTAHADTGRGLAWNPAGTQLATTGDDGYLRVWDAASHRLVWQSPREPGFQAVQWSPDGRTLATTTLEKAEIKLWDGATGAPQRSIPFEAERSRAFDLDWSPDGTMLATAHSDRRLRIWDPATGQRLAVLGEGTDLWRSVAWHPHSKALISAGDDGTLFIWSIPR